MKDLVQAEPVKLALKDPEPPLKGCSLPAILWAPRGGGVPGEGDERCI